MAASLTKNKVIRGMVIMEIQWFPGHMAKTRRLIEENLKLVELVLELLDARIPYSSSNPELKRLIPAGKRLIVLNKADLANPAVTSLWKEYFSKDGIPSVCINAVSGEGIEDLLKEVELLGNKIKEKWQKRGRVQKPIRIMIVGIPNVGKSSLINRLAKRSSAKTGDKPGVTRSKQWIKVDKDIILLDTPGILWPKFEDKNIGINLAITGAIKEEILNKEELAANLIEKIVSIDGNIIKEIYGMEHLQEEAYEIVKQIGIKRGCLMSGERVDTLRTSGIILDDFRSGKMGRISLETPESTFG
jgi:ribosome biogenesis GTPase A